MKYRLLKGMDSSKVLIQPVVTRRGIINLNSAEFKDNGLVLEEEDYFYALSHGLERLMDSKLVKVVRMAPKKPAVHKAEPEKAVVPVEEVKEEQVPEEKAEQPKTQVVTKKNNKKK